MYTCNDTTTTTNNNNNTDDDNDHNACTNITCACSKHPKVRRARQSDLVSGMMSEKPYTSMITKHACCMTLIMTSTGSTLCLVRIGQTILRVES